LEYQRLKSFSVDLRQQVEHFEAKQTQRREIEDLLLRKAETDEGLKDIFSSHGNLWEFACSIASRIATFSSYPDIWKSFLAYCKSRKLEPGKRLFEAVGTLTDFEDSIRQGGTNDLANHIGLELEIWLDEAKDEEKQAALQKSLREFLINVKCLDCGEPLAMRLIDGYPKRLLIIEGEVRCFKCNTAQEVLCLKCKNPLKYKGDEHSFICSSCKNRLLLTSMHAQRIQAERRCASRRIQP